MSDFSHLPYRPCVGVMLVNPAGHVFVGKRIDNREGDFWQMPQGGIDDGEDLRQSALRELAEETGIGEHHVTLIAQTRDELFYVLSLSQNAAQLFEATSDLISMLDLGSTATSMDEALAIEDPERQLQFHSSAGGGVRFHGHGAGAELDKTAIQRFLRAVDRGVCERLGAAQEPRA